MELKKKLRSIVLIDDDEPTNYLHEKIIRAEQCAENIFVFQSTEKALHYLWYDRVYDRNDGMEGKTDLILLDLNMPRMDGWEFLGLYLQMPEEKRRSFVIIILTTSMNPDDRNTASKIKELGGFQSKPLTKDMLRGIIQQHFGEILTTS